MAAAKKSAKKASTRTTRARPITKQIDVRIKPRSGTAREIDRRVRESATLTPEERDAWFRMAPAARYEGFAALLSAMVDEQRVKANRALARSVAQRLRGTMQRVESLQSYFRAVADAHADTSSIDLARAALRQHQALDEALAAVNDAARPVYDALAAWDAECRWAAARALAEGWRDGRPAQDLTDAVAGQLFVETGVLAAAVDEIEQTPLRKMEGAWKAAAAAVGRACGVSASTVERGAGPDRALADDYVRDNIAEHRQRATESERSKHFRALLDATPPEALGKLDLSRLLSMLKK